MTSCYKRREGPLETSSALVPIAADSSNWSRFSAAEIGNSADEVSNLLFFYNIKSPGALPA